MDNFMTWRIISRIMMWVVFAIAALLIWLWSNPSSTPPSGSNSSAGVSK